jgi:predicted Zn-dependent protease
MVCCHLVNCIICHLKIIEGEDKEQTCPNGHPVHHDCLKDWIIHSQNCPLCNEPYLSNTLIQFQYYIQQKEIEELSALQNLKKQEENEKMKMLADKMAFLKFEESINILINENKYDSALSMLDIQNNGNQSTVRSRNILFLKGKINYLRGRYDLAINQLFKLVKEDYEYPDGFLYLGKAYEALGLTDKAKWAFERVK